MSKTRSVLVKGASARVVSTGSASEKSGFDIRIGDAIFWIVQKAVSGFGPFASAEALAEEFLAAHADREEAIDALVRSELVKAGASGFLMGLPGLLALPITIPANLGTDYLLGARVVAAIAKIRGWNLNEPKVQASVVLCLLGHHGKEVVKNVSKSVGIKTAQSIVGAAAAKAAVHLEHTLGSKILARVVESGAGGLVKAIPLAGGILGAGIDASYLLVTSKAAKDFFPDQNPVSSSS